MATHSSILAWRIPWTEEPGGLQSMGLRRLGHDWARTLRRRKRGAGIWALAITPHHLINNHHVYKRFSDSPHDLWSIMLDIMALTMGRTRVSHFWCQCPHQPAFLEDRPTPVSLFHLAETEAGSRGQPPILPLSLIVGGKPVWVRKSFQRGATWALHLSVADV